MTTPDPSLLLATVEELQERLDWTLDDDETRVANAALADLSDDARAYGRDDWTKTTAPRQVVVTVLRAAQRYMRNPDNYIQSRAGDETVMWTNDSGGPAEFRDSEKELIRALAGNGMSFGSMGVVAWGTKLPPRNEGYVPSGYDGKPFPLYESDDSPWPSDERNMIQKRSQVIGGY